MDYVKTEICGMFGLCIGCKEGAALIMVDTIAILLSRMNTIGNDESGIFLFALRVAWIAKLIQT